MFITAVCGSCSNVDEIDIRNVKHCAMCGSDDLDIMDTTAAVDYTQTGVHPEVKDRRPGEFGNSQAQSFINPSSYANDGPAPWRTLETYDHTKAIPGADRYASVSETRECPQCHGSGKESTQAADRGNRTYDFPCSKCGGTGRVRKESSLREAKLPPMTPREREHNRQLGNKKRREGLERCRDCGCKYWENDRCIDCGGTEPMSEKEAWGSLHTASDSDIAALHDAVDEHARHPKGTLKEGDRIGSFTVRDVGTHTVAFQDDDGWSTFVQIPFVGPMGETLPAHQRALDALEDQSVEIDDRRYSSLHTAVRAFDIPSNVGARDFDPNTLRDQIGMGNILSISGGRIGVIYKKNKPCGINLPVSSGYVVAVYLADDDTYTVQRIWRDKVKGEQTGVYAEDVGEAAYQAGMYRSNSFGGHVVGALHAAGDHTSVEMSEIPTCDICGEHPATVDGATIHGPWAYMCDHCYPKHGVGLGLGRGQRLIKREGSLRTAGIMDYYEVVVAGPGDEAGMVVKETNDLRAAVDFARDYYNSRKGQSTRVTVINTGNGSVFWSNGAPRMDARFTSSIDPRYDMDPLHDIRGTTEMGRCSSCFNTFRITSKNPTDPVGNCPWCGSMATSVAGPTNTHVMGAREAKINQIAEGILETNPSMDARQVLVLAAKTLERFPRMAADKKRISDAGVGAGPPKKCSHCDKTFPTTIAYIKHLRELREKKSTRVEPDDAPNEDMPHLLENYVHLYQRQHEHA